jgi:hypothetical protein
MMETLNCADCTAPGKTVLEQIIEHWGRQRKHIERDIDEVGLDPTLPDLRNVVVCYAKVMRGEEPREVSGVDRVELLRRWFMPAGANLTAQERRLIKVFNNISAGNARQMIEGVAVLLRGLGQAGWVVLIDEQEIVPMLLTPRQRRLCNQNLKVIVDTVNQSRPPRAIYYVFASGPDFFTDPTRGVNAYQALRDRIKPMQS